MKILFLAPEPFFQERGTPIAVRLALQVIAERIGKDGKHESIDLLTYHEGESISIPGVTLHRIPALPFLNGVGPGISLKKLICDVIFTVHACILLLKAKLGGKRYDLVHAVEESVFIALLFKLLFGVPYLYDMDSSLALQVTEKWFGLRPLYPVLAFFEGLAFKHSIAVAPVCDALAVIANKFGAKYTHVVRDISLLNSTKDPLQVEEVRSTIRAAGNDLLTIYIGNLEGYQGIDLLIEGFAIARAAFPASHLVIIGGRPEHVAAYQAKVRLRGLDSSIHLMGPRPVSQLDYFIRQADILASPRIRGNNTPMKVYSYLHSGKPIIATNLPTHTQVMDSSVAVLTELTAESFGQGLLQLLKDSELRLRLSKAAFNLAEEKYTFGVFKQRLNELYDRVALELQSSPAIISNPSNPLSGPPGR